MSQLFGAIEAGGTKFVCAVGTGPNDLQEVRFPTTTPEETLGKAVDFFRPFRQDLVSIGVGTFGPVDLNLSSDTYGHITSTPKKHWSHTDFIGTLRKEFDIAYGFDTDVNAAALSEAKWGAGNGLSNLVYITIGTGVGAGVLAGGKLVHGLVHPELGHMFLPKHPDDNFAGNCPSHGDACFEGLCAGPAIEARWGKPGFELGEGHPAWELQAHYVATALVNIICTLSPEKIILGGGVMDQEHLLVKIRAKTLALLNGYVQHPALLDGIDSYIVRPGLGNKAGVLGSMLLGSCLLGESF